MKIKNKYTKQKIDKKEQLINRWINAKKYIRLKTQKFIKLSKREEWLYNPKLICKNDISKIEDDKYIHLKNIMMINYIKKNNCNKLYKGIINLYGNNPLKGFEGIGVNPKELKKAIDDFSYSNNLEMEAKEKEYEHEKEILELKSRTTINEKNQELMNAAMSDVVGDVFSGILSGKIDIDKINELSKKFPQNNKE